MVLDDVALRPEFLPGAHNAIRSCLRLQPEERITIITDREKGYSLVDREAEPGFRSISVPVRRYDGAIVAAINMGAHVDRVSTGEMIDRFLPLLRDAADSVKPLLL